MYKSCSVCGKIHDMNYKCYDHRKTTEDKLRSTYRWAKKSRQIKKDADYLCEVCRDKGIIEAGKEVHHITKLRNNNDKLLDDSNLICLCVACHKKADAGLIDKNYLLELAKKRISKF